jgi:hypothetical protein
VPSKANLAIYQGDDYAAVVTVSNGGADPPDLTGYIAQAQIRDSPADAETLVAVEIGVAIAPPNFINLLIRSDVTVNLSGRYVWDLQLTDPLGFITTILAGDVFITPEVTRE